MLVHERNRILSRRQIIKFEYIIAGAVTRGGNVYAYTLGEAWEMVQKMLQTGDSIYKLAIDRR